MANGETKGEITKRHTKKEKAKEKAKMEKAKMEKENLERMKNVISLQRPTKDAKMVNSVQGTTGC